MVTADAPNLNVGCGQWLFPDAVNLDRSPLPGVDVVHDLDVFPWPFPDERFDGVWGHQVFEHVADPIGFMVEAHRVLKPGGILHLTVPHWQSENSYTDPTHRRHCTERTFDYWCLGTDLNRQFGPAYGAPTPLFHKDNVERVADDVNALLRKV